MFIRLGRCSIFAIGAFAGLFSVSSLLAQGEILPPEGESALLKEYKDYRINQPLLFKGEIAVRTKADEEKYAKVVDFEARWTLYRFTWPDQNEPGKIDRFFKEFEADLANLTNPRHRPTTDFALAQFGKQICVRGKEVLQTSRPIARLNAARVMERMSSSGAAANEFADAFLEVLADANEKNDGVKLFALRGLRNLLTPPPPGGKPFLEKDREEKAVRATLEFVERKVEFTKEAPREEVEGFKSLRREGFRALASSRSPSLSDKVKPGLVLLKACVRDGFMPETRLDEQLEAAVGVTRLDPELDLTYNKDYAAFIVGHFIVELGTIYQQRKTSNDRPYKIYAAKLLDGFEGMKTETKRKPVDDYSRRLVAESAKVLNKMLTDGAADPTDLRNWLERNPPPNKQLFQGGADSTVKPAPLKDEQGEQTTTTTTAN